MLISGDRVKATVDFITDMGTNRPGRSRGTKILKKILLITLIFILLAIIGGTVFFINLKHYAEQPAGPAAERVVITIPAGQSLKTTTEALFQNKIITSPFKFNMLARLKGYDKRLKAGEYALSATMAPIQHPQWIS